MRRIVKPNAKAGRVPAVPVELVVAAETAARAGTAEMALELSARGGALTREAVSAARQRAEREFSGSLDFAEELAMKAAAAAWADLRGRGFKRPCDVPDRDVLAALHGAHYPVLNEMAAVKRMYISPLCRQRGARGATGRTVMDSGLSVAYFNSLILGRASELVGRTPQFALAEKEVGDEVIGVMFLQLGSHVLKAAAPPRRAVVTARSEAAHSVSWRAGGGELLLHAAYLNAADMLMKRHYSESHPAVQKFVRLAYEAPLRANPDDLRALNEYGAILGMQGNACPGDEGQERYAEALCVFDHVLAIDPTNASALYDKSQVLRKLGRRAEAVKFFNAALDLDPVLRKEIDRRVRAGRGRP